MIKMNSQDLTLLSEGQIWGNSSESQLEVIRKYGTKAAITDLCVLTGSYLCEDTDYNIDEDKSLTGRTSRFWTKSDDGVYNVCGVNLTGNRSNKHRYQRNGVVRPALQSFVIFSQISPSRVRGYNGTEEVEYGEYPQNAADSRMQNILESEYNRGMNKTGRSYTFDSVKYDDYDTGFKPVTYEEYDYQGKEYIRIKANSDFGSNKFKLSNGVEYRNGDYVWVEVSPVKWLIDDRTGILISKKGLVSGIRFLDKNLDYTGDFAKTEMKEYLDRYMLRDLTQTVTFTRVQNMTPEEKERFEEKQKQAGRRNSYGLKFGQVSEEEIIRGATESGVAVFLHGPSSEGKSARVKQIDPTCEIIYLRNATPERLNGKSVYNSETGEMIDVKPSWLKKLEEKCEKEPDRFHIVFLDEITNALFEKLKDKKIRRLKSYKAIISSFKAIGYDIVDDIELVKFLDDICNLEEFKNGLSSIGVLCSAGVLSELESMNYIIKNDKCEDIENALEELSKVEKQFDIELPVILTKEEIERRKKEVEEHIEKERIEREKREFNEIKNNSSAINYIFVGNGSGSEENAKYFDKNGNR